MPMHVTRENDAASLGIRLLPHGMKKPDHALSIINSRVQEFGWIFPPPVQVNSHQRRPIIPMDNSIRV